MKKFYTLFAATAFSIPAFCQQAPEYGTTTFNHITEYSDVSYDNDTWAENVENTGWDFTAYDAAGSFFLKKHATGGCEDYTDAWISVDHSSMSYIKFRSNDGSAFNFQSVSVRPDAVADIRFHGYLNGEEVPGALKGFRNNQPEKWAMYTFDDIPAFGNVDEIFIETSVPLHLLGFDNIMIAPPVLKVSEAAKNSSVQLSQDNQTLLIISKENFKAGIYTADGRMVKSLEILKGSTRLDISAFTRGIYIISFRGEKGRDTRKFRIE